VLPAAADRSATGSGRRCFKELKGVLLVAAAGATKEPTMVQPAAAGAARSQRWCY
jgi:hypothetical protein